MAPTTNGDQPPAPPAIDMRLAGNLDKPLALKPNEWASGDIVWLIAVAGDPRAVPKLLKKLTATEFKGRVVKLRATGADGKALITTLDAYAASKDA